MIRLKHFKIDFFTYSDIICAERFVKHWNHEVYIKQWRKKLNHLRNG